MITNTFTGERAKIETKQYADFNRICKINANILYEYICFRRIVRNTETIDKKYWISDVKYHRSDFYAIHESIENFIKNIHKLYISYYVYKKYYEETNDIFLKHIQTIHKTLYVPFLRKKEKRKITRDLVEDFFFEKEPREVFFIFNEYLVHITG
jgi:hypothetical protein